MKEITRRAFNIGAGALAAAAAVPVGIELHKRGMLPEMDDLAKLSRDPLGLNPNQGPTNTPGPIGDEGVTTPGVSRSSLSLGDRTQPLPLGIWLGLGDKSRGPVAEVTYYGYQRFWLTSGSQVVGSGGFYRVVGEVNFPPNISGVMSATHLLVFEGDVIGSNDALAAILLPERIIAPRGTPVQIRDVNIDLHVGMGGNWSDGQEFLSQRLKRAFRNWSVEADTGFNQLAAIPNVSA